MNPTTDVDIQKVEYHKLYIPLLDDDININEFYIALQEIGNDIGPDAIHPSIVRLFTPSLKITLIKLLNKILGEEYPESWKSQLLLTLSKKGSAKLHPKGIAISSLTPNILDIVLCNRFKIWFNSNAAQAGYKTSQGCMVQIFVIVLFIELANWANMTLFLGLMDYEKAFDFINRADLVN